MRKGSGVLLPTSAKEHSTPAEVQETCMSDPGAPWWARADSQGKTPAFRFRLGNRPLCIATTTTPALPSPPPREQTAAPTRPRHEEPSGVLRGKVCCGREAGGKFQTPSSAQQPTPLRPALRPGSPDPQRQLPQGSSCCAPPHPPPACCGGCSSVLKAPSIQLSEALCQHASVLHYL